MTILAVDTSCAVASAAVIRDGVCVLERDADTDRRHAETVQPLIEAVLDEAGLSVRDIDLFAVDVGPGSFTGVRIGVSAVNAMAYAAGKRVVPVDALAALAEPYADTGEPVAAILDAGNGNVYFALLRAGEALIAPDAPSMAECAERIPAGAHIVGDTGSRDSEKTYPTAKQVGLRAYRSAEAAVDMAKPMYLRPSQAERMWKLRQEGRRA